MSSYYELPDIEPQRGSQKELEQRLMARVAQVASRTIILAVLYLLHFGMRSLQLWERSCTGKS